MAFTFDSLLGLIIGAIIGVVIANMIRLYGLFRKQDFQLKKAIAEHTIRLNHLEKKLGKKRKK